MSRATTPNALRLVENHQYAAPSTGLSLTTTLSRRGIQTAKERERPTHASAHHLRQMARLKEAASSIPKATLTGVTPINVDSMNLHRQLIQPTNKLRLQSPSKDGGATAPSPVPRPLSTNAFKARKVERTRFRYFYDRGDLPVRVSFAGAVRKLQWQVDLAQLDYTHYLPMFMEGLRELDEPYHFLAVNGTVDMLEKGQGRPLTCLPQLVLPMKQNLMTRNHKILCVQMKVLQKLVQFCPFAGEALVPYYRQLLSIFNLFIAKRINCGDAIDYSQRHQENLGDLILETLNILERTGGADAFVNMKYMIPTYESCMTQF